MDDTICYLNTDLDLVSANDLTELAAVFEKQGHFECTRGHDGQWYATFEMLSGCDPEPAIATMLDIIESLAASTRSAWTACTLREFNIGYDCGSKPWVFNQGLSSQLLGRVAAVGASLRITLYPPEKPA